jgi:hypothetical protein
MKYNILKNVCEIGLVVINKRVTDISYGCQAFFKKLIIKFVWRNDLVI